MFTNEFEFDSSITTVLDDTGELEDVQLIIGDGGDVLIRQFNPRTEFFDVIVMSADMFGELLAALKKPEGAYRSVITKKE